MNLRRRYLFGLCLISLVAAASSETCISLLDRTNRPERYILHSIPGFRDSISIAEVEAHNMKIEESLIQMGIVYREVDHLGAFAMTRADGKLEDGHPLKGKFKAFEIEKGGQIEAAHPLQHALLHPDFNRELKALNEKGTAVIIDASLSFGDAAGVTSQVGTELRLMPNASWSTFKHEQSHVRFIDEVYGKMIREGYFDELRAFLDEARPRWAKIDPKWEEKPFFPADMNSPGYAAARKRAFERLAKNVSKEEYEQLLAERSPLGYAIKHIREGFDDGITIDESAATSLERDLYKDAGMSPLSRSRLGNERYQLSFQITELASKLHPTVEDGLKLRRLMAKNYMYLLLEKAPIPRTIDELNRFLLKAIAVGGVGLAGYQVYSSTTEEKKDDDKNESPSTSKLK